ncbi:MAG: hypothetical protein GY862_26050 [Gammaproteobacteria bacterium]|nr:hypothetical protein [Gammaproteobacteria bacterium]
MTNDMRNKKHQLIELLLECPSVKDPQIRPSLPAQLPGYIAVAINASDNPVLHAVNIVDACMNHNSGLEYLLDALRFFDEKTIQFQNMDFADVRLHRQKTFLSYVLNELDLSKQASDLADFSEALEEKLDKPAVFLMDNVEKGLHAKGLDEEFWWHIRAMGQNCDRIRIGFCGTSRLSAGELEEESDALGKPSPFINALAEVELGPLNEEEARELISYSPKPFSPKDTNWILEHSRRWPVLLQLLCKARLAALEENAGAWKQTALDCMQSEQHSLASWFIKDK